jgi:hypothetical protein
MQDSIDRRLPPRWRRARSLAPAALVSGLLFAGCGGSSAVPTTTSVVGATSSRQTASDTVPNGLDFARCMRSNGVPNFPDPSPGGGFVFSLQGINPKAPAVQAAQAKCRSLMPSGPPTPGTTTHASAHTMDKLREIAVCMREHGVPDFPDPRTSVPARPFGSGSGVITDYDGAILLFPSTIGLQSPAYKRAGAACGALAQTLGNGPRR